MEDIEALKHQIGSLKYEVDYLKRGAADDALTSHTQQETNARLQKDNDYLRRMLFTAIEKLNAHNIQHEIRR